MSHSRRVLFLLFDRFELLDMAGPASVFTTVNGYRGERSYEIVALSSDGGAVRSWSGVEVATAALETVELSEHDTVIAVGGVAEAVGRAAESAPFIQMLKAADTCAERVASVCTGAFLLAHAGLVDDRAVTTHWSACRPFAERFPTARLDGDAIYVRDGRLWSSAGVSSGIDMALAMVAVDWGETMKGKVARMLVVYAHRPGGQAQFSELLGAQLAAGSRFAELVDWIETNLARPLRVADLAARAAMSERSLVRKFDAAFGTSPARFVESLRLERAKALLEAGRAVKAVAPDVGFRSEAAFRSAFERRFGVAPSLFRRLHSRAAQDERP